MNIKLIKIANETIKISKDKYYLFQNSQKDLNTNKKHPVYEKYNTDSVTIKDPGTLHYIEVKTHAKKVEVVEETTVDTILRFSNIYSPDTIGILNFASAKHPGGGFLNGAVAQEECLAYCSNLYMKQLKQDYYQINKKYNKFYTDTMIISHVNFFRDA